MQSVEQHWILHLDFDLEIETMNNFTMNRPCCTENEIFSFDLVTLLKKPLQQQQTHVVHELHQFIKKETRK